MSAPIELLVEARNEIDERLCTTGLSLNRVAAIMATVDAVLAETFGEEVAPGACPATVEGSESSGAVVATQADGDHAVAGEVPGDTMTVNDLLTIFAEMPDHDVPVRLEVLGDIVDVDRVALGHDEVLVVGAEVVE